MRIRFMFEIRIERPVSAPGAAEEFEHRDTEALIEHGDYEPPLEMRHVGFRREEP